MVLADRREFEAKLVGSDERADLAVLHIDTHGERLPALEFGDSDAAEVGDLVLAIGDPFAVGQTVTSGIISALARTGLGINDFNFFIQTDAAINPGNSGGALVTMDGKLIGVNTAIYSGSGGSIGIGFAIPSNMVRTVVRGILAGGKLVRPWFGAQGETVTAEIAGSLGLSRPMGVLVNDVYKGGPAAAAGLKPGDVILKIDGRAVNDAESLRYRIATKPLNGKADLAVYRRGQQLDLTIALTAPPETVPRETTRLEGSSPLTGATVTNLSPAVADELGVSAFQKGVVVTKVGARHAGRQSRRQAGRRHPAHQRHRHAQRRRAARGLGAPVGHLAAQPAPRRARAQRGGQQLSGLFEASAPHPLADRLRPKSLDEVVGQDHLLAADGPIGRMVKAGRLASIILWGPPGSGKTTIARLLAQVSKMQFVLLSAVFSGVADLRKVFDAAKKRRAMGEGTLLFIDEIHRFNRAQQDGFLPYVEDGTVTLVGATTENPSFELNAALLSRCQVLVLRRLDDAALEILMARAESGRRPQIAAHPRGARRAPGHRRRRRALCPQPGRGALRPEAGRAFGYASPHAGGAAPRPPLRQGPGGPLQPHLGPP